MSAPTFTKVVITRKIRSTIFRGELENDVDSSPMNTFLIAGDLNNNGLPDIVVSGRNGRMAWFENPGPGRERQWRRHIMADVHNMECGGVLLDLDGDGYNDVVLGGDYRSGEMRWWQNPHTPGA